MIYQKNSIWLHFENIYELGVLSLWDIINSMVTVPTVVVMQTTEQIPL